MEFVIGAAAATSAGIFTNPLDVVKHHMELNKKTQYKYKNMLHAGFKVARRDGIKSLQKGLSPAQFAANRGFTKNANGQVAIPKSIFMSGVGGILGQYLSSPFYLLKMKHEGKETYGETARRIYRENGIRGFFRGATASLPRAFISTSQLTTFAVAKESLSKFESFKSNPLLTTFLASNAAGIVLSLTMTPFDMVLTKMYKQAVTAKSAKDRIYEGLLDCVKKTYKANGFKPFYQGFGPLYLKLGPHTVLCLVFWEEFKGIYDSHNVCNENFYQNKFGFLSSPEFFTMTDSNAVIPQLPQEENDF